MPMNSIKNRVISIVLAICLLVTSTVSASAAGVEHYLSDLRLVYANSYDEAKEIIKDSEFSDYEVYKYNLNKDTGKIGVWLAYKTTTDVDDAITDVAVIQMNGGYREGNYQEMIKESYKKYLDMGNVYKDAIDYFADAYDAGDFFAESAYRQLNFYVDMEDHDGERLGDLFIDGIDPAELATMFMQGNSYALRNIRSLLAQGVSYNDSGETYLELVAAAAEEMNEDESVFDDEEYDELAILTAGSIITLGDMFEELASVEAELDYTDDEFTELEFYYAEYMAMATMLSEVEYLDGKTLYDFCLDYELDEEDLSDLYPLVAALNEGQVALAKVGHFYDVVRYSMSDLPEEQMDAQIAELEEEYSLVPFDIYTGVDRSIYNGSFALTSNAYRADASTEEGLMEALSTGEQVVAALGIGAGALSAGLFVWAICRTRAPALAQKAVENATAMVNNYIQTGNAATLAKSAAALNLGGAYQTYGDVVNGLLAKYFSHLGAYEKYLNLSLHMKINAIKANASYMGISAQEISAIDAISKEIPQMQALAKDAATKSLDKAQKVSEVVTSKSYAFATGALYLVSGVLLLYSAISLGITAYNYKHPDYDDIPVAMVDMIETADGDRYIKYDVVLEAEPAGPGEYDPGDLNAFGAERWNALYYTKSYEAGKPLLANFSLSNSSNVAKENHLPVHRFGENICYDLNKYNFDNDSDNIYLSIKQSEKQKSAIADVPAIVGSTFSTGYYFLAAGIGVALGVGGTLLTKSVKKKSEDL